jgi:acetyl/propionyl-CoA carboxylase alpha subunit
MRRVDRLEDVDAAAESASAEASAAFGDGTLFLERYLARPRHIEVQVFGDGAGNGVHLHERDCSLQRRHQKILEEAQAPHLDSTVRAGLVQAAMKLVSITQYRNAGTIEFLLDENGQFYFLEMNTRLQVEHPVTELISGIDLVAAQIHQALSPKTQVLKITPEARGHAIEVRIYAEDPAQGFIPTPGRIEKLRWPTGAGIRVDSGIEEGQEVGAQFDSLLGKLIVHAQDRTQAIERLKFALEETVILGIGTNQNYLRTLLDHPQVKEGRIYTGFLAEEMSAFQPVPTQEDLQLWLSAKSTGFGHLSSGFASNGSLENKKHPSPWENIKRRGINL